MLEHPENEVLRERLVSGELSVSTDRVGLTGESATASLPPPHDHGAYMYGADAVLFVVARPVLVAFATAPVTMLM